MSFDAALSVTDVFILIGYLGALVSGFMIGFGLFKPNDKKYKMVYKDGFDVGYTSGKQDTLKQYDFSNKSVSTNNEKKYQGNPTVSISEQIKRHISKEN